MDPNVTGPLFDLVRPEPQKYLPLVSFLVVAPAFVIGLVGLVRRRLPAAMALLGLGVLPVVGYGLGNLDAMTSADATDFCSSCHVMTPIVEAARHGEGLAGRHIALGAIPVEAACHTCHGGYGPWGGVRAKLAGVHHMWLVLTQGALHEISYPIEYWGSYDVRQCLNCHSQATAFRQQTVHQDPDLQNALINGELGCTGACHPGPHPESALAAPKGGAK